MTHDPWIGYLALLLVLSMSGRAHAQHIITFDAPQSGTHRFQGTQATGINVDSTVTGNVTDNDNVTHGFVRTREARFTNFDAPGANQMVGGTFPNGINGCGEVAGTYVDANSVSHGFVRSPHGELTTFNDSHVPAGTSAYQGTTPIGINDSGVIAGTYTDGDNVTHGFVRDHDGNITTFDPRGSTYTQVGGINYLGQIAGVFYDANGVGHAFVRSAEGSITTFEPPAAVGGDAETDNAFINHFGVVARSYYEEKSNAQYGYQRSSAARFTEFAAPKASETAYFGTELAAINLLGMTTGTAFTNSVGLTVPRN